MSQCLHAAEETKQSLRRSTKTKGNVAHKSYTSIIDHSGFDCEFDGTFTDQELGNWSCQQLSNGNHEDAKKY